MPAQHLERVYLPGDPPVNEFGQLLTAADPKAFLATYPFDVSPVNDDRPFFFYTVQPRDLWNFLGHRTEAADYKINRALPLLFELLAVSLLATVVVLALPPLLLGARLPAGKGVRGFLLYFVFIGAGYILIQIALIQKFVLFLGHPTYALTVIIFSMLVSSGLGSFFSRHITLGRGGPSSGRVVGHRSGGFRSRFHRGARERIGRRLAAPLENGRNGCLNRPRGLSDGHAVSYRAFALAASIS